MGGEGGRARSGREGKREGDGNVFHCVIIRCCLGGEEGRGGSGREGKREGDGNLHGLYLWVPGIMDVFTVEFVKKVITGFQIYLKAEILFFLHAAVSSVEMYSEIRLVQWLIWQ